MADSQSEKKLSIKKIANFLSGKTENQLDKKNNSKTELPGLFNYVIQKWWNAKPEEGSEDDDLLKKKPKSLFDKIGEFYSSYQKIKENEVEKLHIYESIKLSARLSKEFLVLLIGSCLIATIGLFQDSSAVIIGAMLIAPLMMPILGFSLGIIWGDKDLLKRSIWTLFIGSIFVLIIATFLSWAIPGVSYNDQINARINPNLYDIFIALASGFVGAYAYVNPKISSRISGVAISVALIS